MSKLIPYSRRMSSGPIDQSTETALGLVYNFLNEQKLRALSDFSIGGTFPIKDFRLNPKCYAKQFWFCFNKANRDPNQRAFLALEDSWRGWPRNMTEKEIPKKPEAKVLVRPGASFAFDDNHYDRKNIVEVSDFILSHTDRETDVKKISAGDVSKYGRSFVSAFGGKDKKFCRYPLGYFENYELESGVCYIDKFLEQGEIAYVRYFFGLDKTYPSNRIRIVLFPVHTDKKALRLIGDNSGGMLEASWPPPPPKVE